MRAPRTLPLVIAGSLALCTAGAACSAILGLEPPPVPGDGGADAALVDATTGDSPASEGAPPDRDGGAHADAASDAALCVPLDGGGDGSTTYFPLSETIIDDAGTHTWQYFEPSSVNTLARDFQGGVYDGRYVYFTPSGSGTITRYDTQRAFGVGTSWSTFDTSTLAAGAQGYNGAVYDGRYVYFVPYRSPGGYDGLLVRYDTQRAFGAPAAWALFDLGALPMPDGGGAATGFAGGVFDGRGVYLAPDYDGVEHLSRVVRYDPDGGAVPDAADDAGDGGPRDAGDAGDGGDAGPREFGNVSQVSLFDVSTRNASAAGFLGALFDGRYVYLVPYQNNAGNSGVLARYDTDASFVAGPSWGVVDTTAIHADAYGFVGAAFDGRYVYLVPHARTVVARYDTQAGLTLPNKAAWSTFDVAAIQPADAGALAFAGGAFDGRFVYFVPSTGAQALGAVVRYDTWSTFGAACAWSTHDVSQDVAGATNYYGAVYDGQYLYLVPKGTWVARFETKTPASMPSLPGYNGSFY